MDQKTIKMKKIKNENILELREKKKKFCLKSLCSQPVLTWIFVHRVTWK